MSIYSFVADNTDNKSGSAAENKAENKHSQRANDINSETIKKEIELSRRECLGWKIFKYKNSDSAIAPERISIATFMEDGAEEEEVMKNYESLSAYGEGIVFTAISKVYAEEFTVISFNSTGSEIPLSEIDTETKRSNALLIFKSIITAMNKLNSALTAAGGSYIPLSCICEETVYLIPDLSGNTDFSRIKILPVFPKKNAQYPLWLPSEKPGIKTDIFYAGFLCKSLASNIDESCEPGKTISKCCNIFADERPDLEEILTVLGESEGAYKSNAPQKKIESVNDDRNPEYKGRIKIKCPDFIRNIYDKVLDFIIPIIDKIKEFLKSENNDRGGTTE